MQIPILANEHILTFLKPYGRDLSLKVGELIRAEVLNVTDKGVVSLRVTNADGESGILVAKTSMQLTRGSMMNLKVAGGDNEIKLQFIGLTSDSSTRSRIGTGEVPSRVLQALAGLAGSKLRNSDLRTIGELFRSLPPNLKAAFPEFEALERLMPEIQKLSAELLRTSVEGSGVLFETRLKLAAREMLQLGKSDILERLLGSEPDQKGLLLKVRDMLRDEQMTGFFKSSGLRPAEVSGAIDRLIRNIEFFQLSSKIHDIFYTFLPVTWPELRDGEISFRKGRDDGRPQTYTCDVTLDLNPAGRLRISVSLHDGGFFVTFCTEEPRLMSLLSDARATLDEYFGSAGLPLKAVNITQKAGIRFEPEKKQGLDMKV